MAVAWFAGESSAFSEQLSSDSSYFNSLKVSGQGGGTATVFKRNCYCKQLLVLNLFEFGCSHLMLCAVIHWPHNYNKNFLKLSFHFG